MTARKAALAAARRDPQARARELAGLLWGLVGVTAFSLTLPVTRSVVASLDIGFVILGRAIGAGLVAAVILWVTRQPLPRPRDLIGLFFASAGIAVGFPGLIAYAMLTEPASRGAVVTGLLPLSTAVAGALLAGERPSRGFWLASLAGTAVVLAFLLDGADLAARAADLALIGAVVSAAAGYAIGGRLAGRLGAWQVTCWSLVATLPPLVLVALLLGGPVARPGTAAVPWSAWLGFGYLVLVSQLLGFFAWYRGLALGGIARVSQIQLLQVFLTLVASALLIGERIAPRTFVYGVLVMALVGIGTRLRARRIAAEPHQVAR